MDNSSGSATTVLRDRSSLYAANVRDPGIVIDDGDAGYSDTGWTAKNTNGAYQGDHHTRAGGDGSQIATWTFIGLEAGATYRVAVTWKAPSGNATNASFTIFDSAVADATKTVNQRIAPNDMSIADKSWEDLGTYQVTGTTLTVQLSNLADGTVVADAIRIVKVSG